MLNKYVLEDLEDIFENQLKLLEGEELYLGPRKWTKEWELCGHEYLIEALDALIELGVDLKDIRDKVEDKLKEHTIECRTNAKYELENTLLGGGK